MNCNLWKSKAWIVFDCNVHCLGYRPTARYTRRLFKSLTFTGYSSSTRELDRAARKDLNEERRRSKLAEQEKKSRETEKAERLAKQRELAKTLAATLRYTPSAWNNYNSHCTLSWIGVLTTNSSTCWSKDNFLDFVCSRIHWNRIRCDEEYLCFIVQDPNVKYSVGEFCKT